MFEPHHEDDGKTTAEKLLEDIEPTELAWRII